MLFYVYALARPVKKHSPHYRVFYIGKGLKYRVFEHERQARRGVRSHRHNLIRKVWQEGDEIQRYILLTTEDEQEAFAYEIEMIALHGRENLCNLTDGGEGASNPSPETRAKRSASVRKAKNTPESKARQSAASKALYTNPVYRAKNAARLRARWDDPQTRAKQSLAIKAARSTPESREKTRQQLLGHTVSEETRAKLRITHKGRKGARLGMTNSPEHRRKASAALKGRKLSEDQVRRMSEALKGKPSKMTPEARERLRERMKGNTYGAGVSQKGKIITEEARRKISATLSRHWLVTLPGGDQVTVPHLGVFCKEHDLNYNSLICAARRGKPYRGYYAIIPISDRALAPSDATEPPQTCARSLV